MNQPPASSSEASLDFAALFEQYYPRVYNYVRYRVSVPQDAEDLTSAIFEKAYTRRSQFKPARGSFDTWLFTIAHHSLANYYRSRQRRAGWESAQALPADLALQTLSPEAGLIKQEALLQLLQGLERLNNRDQEVISLKFAGRLSNRQIGQIMGLKEKTVSVVLLRAMRRLQQEVNQRQP